MASRPVGNGNISFGLVSIPVRLFPATRSKSVSFNLLHAKDQSRIQQKIFCPVDNAIIDRSELVRGYEVAKDRYVTFTDEELKALEAPGGNHSIEITEFVPLEQIDPLYFETSYYLGCEQASAKAYRLLTDAMTKTGRVALGRYTLRGKEHVVVLRPYEKGLMMHTIYYADEVRSIDEIDRATNEAAKESELALAERLIGELTSKKIDLCQVPRHLPREGRRGRAAEDRRPAGDRSARGAAPRPGDRFDGGAQGLARKARRAARGARSGSRGGVRQRSRRGIRSGKGDGHGRRQDARPHGASGRQFAPPRRRQKVTPLAPRGETLAARRARDLSRPMRDSKINHVLAHAVVSACGPCPARSAHAELRA